MAAARRLGTRWTPSPEGECHPPSGRQTGLSEQTLTSPQPECPIDQESVSVGGYDGCRAVATTRMADRNVCPTSMVWEIGGLHPLGWQTGMSASPPPTLPGPAPMRS